MVLGGDVPLEKDIFRKDVEFVKTWVEWATDNREQIFRIGVAANSVSTIFTVPANNTLYITHVSVSTITGANSGTARMRQPADVNQGDLVSQRIIPNSNLVSSADFTMPIKVDAGGSIIIANSGVGVVTNGIIIGFIVPKRIT